LKFFLTASAEERGKRRYKELTAKGVEIDLAQVIDEIKKRDHIDSTREFAPLKRAEGAIEIDTTFLDIEGVIEAILSYVNR
jgi:cytidylate kinase